MSPIKRGAPIKGYEAKNYKIYARVEPIEYENFMMAAKLAGDSKADALRKGMHLYIAMVRSELRKDGG